MTRLYTSSAGDDARVSPHDGDGRVSQLISCEDGNAAVCDDVFCSHDDDDCQTHGRQPRGQLFHAWAEYRIAQRGIMVSTHGSLTQLSVYAHWVLHKVSK